MTQTASILAVSADVVNELWRGRSFSEVAAAFPGGRLAALIEGLETAGARPEVPLSEAVAAVRAIEGRAVFEALCEAVADGVWDAPGWTLRPLLDVPSILSRRRTPYPPGLEPDGFSSPKLYLWLDPVSDGEAVSEATKRLARADAEIEGSADPSLARDVFASVGELLARAQEEQLLVLVAHPHAV